MNDFQDIKASECIPIARSSRGDTSGCTLYEELVRKGDLKPIEPIPHNQLADKESDEEESV